MDTNSISLALADDLFVQCQTLSPWTVNYVDLEESLAVGSIAQEILAHGGVLFEVAGLDAKARDARIYGRESKEWSVAGLSFFSAHHWPDLVAGAYLASQASKAIVESLMTHSDDVRRSLSLVQSEQALHIAHWRRWVSVLMSVSDTAGEMSTAMDEALQGTGDLLPTGSGYDVIHAAWVASISADLSGWGQSASRLAERSARASGDAKISGMINDLRVARANDGSSTYAVY